MMPISRRPATATELASLLYELLDAHADTVALAATPVDDLRWEAHLDYLRALQRTGRAILARSLSVFTASLGSAEPR